MWIALVSPLAPDTPDHWPAAPYINTGGMHNICEHTDTVHVNSCRSCVYTFTHLYKPYTCIHTHTHIHTRTHTHTHTHTPEHVLALGLSDVVSLPGQLLSRHCHHLIYEQTWQQWREKVTTCTLGHLILYMYVHGAC